MNDKPKIIYTTGSGHSGSTLIDMILGSNENCVSVGELNFWDVFVNKDFRKTRGLFYHRIGVCTCQKLLKDCPFWKDIIKKKFVTNTNESRKERKSILKFVLNPFSDPYEIKMDNNDYINLIEEIKKKNKKKYIIDSSKFRNKLIQLIQEEKKGNIELKIIHVIKDGRGVSFSYEKREKRNYLWANLYWIWKNFIIRKIIKKSKVDNIKISYDWFAKNPDKGIKRLEGFTGLKLENYVENIKNTTYHNIAGNNMRFGEFKGIKYDQKWKKHWPIHKKIMCGLISFIPNRMWVYNKK